MVASCDIVCWVSEKDIKSVFKYIKMKLKPSRSGQTIYFCTKQAYKAAFWNGDYNAIFKINIYINMREHAIDWLDWEKWLEKKKKVRIRIKVTEFSYAFFTCGAPFDYRNIIYFLKYVFLTE